MIQGTGLSTRQATEERNKAQDNHSVQGNSKLAGPQAGAVQVTMRKKQPFSL